MISEAISLVIEGHEDFAAAALVKKVLPYFETSTVLGSGVEAPTDGAALPGALIVNRGGVLLLFAVLPC